MKQSHILVSSLEQLDELLRPIRAGCVDAAGVDTETTLIRDNRFTPYGTDSRVAGFSVSYDAEGGTGPVDLYVPVRHVPYDFRRRPELLEKYDREHGTDWCRTLAPPVEGIIACQDGEGTPWYGEWADTWDPNVDPVDAFALLGGAMQADGVRWAAHNWGFDGPMLDVEGIEVPWDRIEETHFASVLTDPRPIDKWDDGKNDGKGGFLVSHALKNLGEDHLGIPADAQKRLREAMDALGAGSSKLMDYSMLPLRTCIAPYAGMDTRLVLNMLRLVEKREAMGDDRVRSLYERERQLIRHVVYMMRRGIRVDPKLAVELGGEAEADVERLTREANKAAEDIKPGTLLALTNPEQLSAQLYDELGFPTYQGKTDTRKPTLKMVRKRVPKDSPQESLLTAVLDWRAKTKEVSAFFKPLQSFGAEGTVHPIIRQMAAATTRMSASAPNVQQVKKKGRVREVFIPRDGHTFVFFDYDQIQMRIAAHYSKVLPRAYDRVFTWGCTLAGRGDCKGRPPHGPADDVNACRDVIHIGRGLSRERKPDRLFLYDGFMTQPDFDPHTRMADVSGESRDDAKTANFALLFGAGYAKLAETLDCSLERAKELWAYFWKDSYPELMFVREFIGERLRQVGPPTEWSHMPYITTLKGGRIYLASSYKGMSYVIQRGEREVLGEGFLHAADYCEVETKGVYKPLVPIHDEAVFEVPTDSIDRAVLTKIRDMMEEAGRECVVPLTVGCETSDQNWRKDARNEVELPERAAT